MNLKKKVRAAVSKDRIRFNDKKHNLDLSYITNNVIAMAFPASGIEATYRNDIDEVSRMLETYHKNNYMIWNLSGRSYDYSKFNHQVLNFGFPDHHSPPLDLLIQIIVSMDNWLSASPEHVAIIHCVGGKGRTGTVISCYLIFTGYFSDPEEALLHFAYMRSMKERGVTQTSQRRYVTYFQNILRNTVRPHPKVLRIRRVVMTAVPCWTKKQGCRPYVNIYHTRQNPRQLVHTTRYSSQTKFYHMDESSSIIWDIDCMVKGDVLLKFYHLKEKQEKVITKTKEGSKKKFEQSMFRVSFHTAFVELHNGGLLLKKPDLDIYHKPKRFRDSLARDEFALIVIMDEVEEHMAQLYEEEDAAITATYEQFFQTMNSERIKSKREINPLPPHEESDVDSFAETDDEAEGEMEEDDDSSSSKGDSLDPERMSSSSDTTPGSASPSVERSSGSKIVPQKDSEKNKPQPIAEQGKERSDSGDAAEPSRNAVAADVEPNAKRKTSMRKIKNKLNKLTKSTESANKRRTDKKKDKKNGPTVTADDGGEEQKSLEPGTDSDGSAVRFEPAADGAELPNVKPRRPPTTHTKTLSSLGKNAHAVSSSDSSLGMHPTSTSYIERGSGQEPSERTRPRSSSLTEVLKAPATRRRPQTTKLPAKPLPPAPSLAQASGDGDTPDGDSTADKSASAPSSSPSDRALWDAPLRAADSPFERSRRGTGPPRKSSTSLSSHRGASSLTLQD